MSTFLVIALIVGVCVLIGAAASQSENQEKSVAAKQPDAFIRIFKEEMPDLEISLTYAGAEEIINNWNATINSDKYQREFFLEKFMTSRRGRCVQMLLENVAKPASPVLYEFGKQNPDEFAAKMTRIISSSKTLAAAND